MYAKCGAFAKARSMLDELPFRDAVAWNALISGYTQHGRDEEALISFKKMQNEGVPPDSRTFACILKACLRSGAADMAEQIHGEVLRQGLLKENILLGSALVDVYAKFGALAKAREVLEQIPSRDVVCWTALVAGYAQHGQGEEALNCFKQMQGEGVHPNEVTFCCILKACGTIKGVEKGKQIHDEIVKQRLLCKHTMLGTALVDMYIRCGALEKAQEVLRGLATREVATWNALIAGFTLNDKADEALICFEEMQAEGVSPDAVTYTCILNACGMLRAADKGEQIHGEIVRHGLPAKDIVLGNALVDMYAKCGAVAKAQEAFKQLPSRDVVTWNALMTGYLEDGQGEGVLHCFSAMLEEGLSPDSVTFICILKACGSLGAAKQVEQIHDMAGRQGLLEKDIVLCNVVLDAYAKCGSFTKAAAVLEGLHARDVTSWNALITGYVDNGQCEEAMLGLKRMQDEGLSPDSITFACILKACGKLGALDKGVQIHNEIARRGLLGNGSVLGIALVDMYVKCGAFAKAEEVFEEVPAHNVVSWNAIITGYAQQGRGEEALDCYRQMRREGLSPNAVTFASMLKACGSLGEVEQGIEVHHDIARHGLEGKDVVLGNALVGMYAKCGALETAQEVLGKLAVRDVATWTALIGGFAQQGQGEEALHCYEQMQHEGQSPNALTFACILKACCCLGAADKGELIHNLIARQGLLGKDTVLGSALVDMYAKCGALKLARQVLDELPSSNLVSWTALIAGYAQQGQSQDSRDCFEQMQCKGISPDASSFCCLLNACSHSGLVQEGRWYFSTMSTKYGIKPDLEHYTCMIDLLGHAGHLGKAIAMIEEMPSHNYLVMWHVLLAACRKWRDVKIGRMAFEHAVQADRTDATAYALMGDIYEVAGMQSDAEDIEALRNQNKAWKKPGCRDCMDQNVQSPASDQI